MLRALLIFFLATPLPAQILVDTYAGGKIPSGVSAQSILLQGVTGVAWDPAGNLVFCDSTNNIIRRIRPDGILETIAGTGITGYGGDGGPALSALLNSPSAPAYDAAGNLYFFDAANYRIRRVDTKGVIATVAGDGIPFADGMDFEGPATAISLPYGRNLTVDATGNVYFSDNLLNHIRCVTPSGMVKIYAGTGEGGSSGDGGPATAATLNYPGAMTTDGAGNLFFVDGGDASSIRRISTSGVITTFVPPPQKRMGEPMFQSLAADQAGDVYAVVGRELVRYSPDGTSSVLAGGGTNVVSSPDGPALPSTISPLYLTVDSRGNIGFLDIFESYYFTLYEIREVTPQSSLKTLAGANPQPVPDGTPLRDAWFLGIGSIVFDHSGNLYFSEGQACLIRKIDPGGNLSTFAGTGVCGASIPTGNAKTANLVYPGSLAVDSQNRLWVADGFLNLYFIAQDGTISAYPTRTPVTGGTGQLAIDAKDRLFVQSMDELVRILPDQTLQVIVVPGTTAGPAPGLKEVDAIGTDPAGNVYFTSHYAIYRMNDDGTYTQIANNPNMLKSGLAIDAKGNIWQGSAEVDVTSASGTARMGAFVTGFSGDGIPAQTSSFSIGTMTFAPNGDLYFVDGARIRKLTGSGPPVAPAISANGVVNAASYVGGGISQGELISIFGANFGVSGLMSNVPQNNSLPTALGRTRVFFNGNPGAITALTPNQINVFVPPYVANTDGSDRTGPVNVTVEVDDSVSAPVNVPLVTSAPGLFTADASGSGQGAILNQDGSINSIAHPAARGTIVSLFGTGEGLESPQLSNGALVISTPFPAPVNPVTATIGGQPAQVLYAGAAPLLPTGVFQINVRIPDGASAGNVPASVSIGSGVTTRQVTIAVQ